MKLTGRSVRAAFAFLTRIPVGGAPYTPVEWAWAAAHFPLVGAAVGAIAGGLYRSFAPVGPLPDAVLCVAASMILTGAMGEEGLAATLDALGGPFDRDRPFANPRKSRIGAFGVCGLVASIAGRAALLDRLGVDAAWALPVAACASRVGPVWQMVALPYVASTGSKSADVAKARSPQAIVATAWFVLVAAIAIGCRVATAARVGALVLVLAGTALATARWYLRRVGGVTSELLGATEQWSELAALAVLAWAGE